MEILEIRLLDEWFTKLKRHGTYNRKWWPKLEDAKQIAYTCHIEQPSRVIEVGTGNGVTASYIATMGIKVATFDPADRPKVYLDETFPLPHIEKFITFFNQPFELSMDFWTTKEKIVWSIDGNPGPKSVVSYLNVVKRIANQGDLILLNGTSERV